MEWWSIAILLSRPRKLGRPLLQKCRNPFAKIVTVAELAHIIALEIELLIQQQANRTVNCGLRISEALGWCYGQVIN